MTEQRAYRLGHAVGKAVFLVLIPFVDGWWHTKRLARAFWRGFSGL